MKNIWKDFEADNYFIRNYLSFCKYNINKDKIAYLVNLFKLKPKKIIEIGAVNGFRLHFLHKLYKSIVYGVEPSKKAIEDGQKKFPEIKFINSTLEKLSLKKKFDLVIINYVFHWFYRENLLLCVDKLDKLVDNNGFLVIGDFGTNNFIKKHYHHLPKRKFYTWKMPYWRLFTQTGNYIELAKLRYCLTTGKFTAKINTNTMGTLVLLKKHSEYIFIK